MQDSPDWTEQREKVFLDRYAMKDEHGHPVEKSPEEMWTRVANAIGDTDEERSYFQDLLEGFRFVPGGRILAGAGTGTEVTYANCWVIPVETRARRSNRRPASVFQATAKDWLREIRDPALQEDKGCDSREAIFDTIGLMVDIMSRGGGVGINWSVLRPAGSYLKSVNGTSSGPVSWMNVASTAVGEVEQGGSRRGAAMFMLDVWHPDILTFIDAKRNLSRILNANVSVCVTDDFMDAVKNDEDWALRYPDTTVPEYDELWDGDLEAWEKKGLRIEVYDFVPARDIWRKMAQAAWDNGEPGVFFIDRANALSTGNGRLCATNPCGEMPLEPYDVCNLGSMNLAAYVSTGLPVIDPTYPAKVVDHWSVFQWQLFRRDVRTAVRFLDNVVDKTHYFLPENEEVQKSNRRVGLSVMGLADALVALELRYGSEEAADFTEKVFRAMRDASIAESIKLAREKGPAPAWRASMIQRPYIWDFLLDNPERETDLRACGLRNIFLLTQAPTGTTSILAGVNSGIEPFFDKGYWRKDRTGEHWVQPAALKGLNSGDETTGDIYPDYVVTADQVTVEEHIAMQAAVQRYVDNSISKTINAPNSHTVEDVERAYMLAYDSGLKGLAYFRDGCGRAQVLNREDYASEDPQASDLLEYLDAALNVQSRGDMERYLERLPNDREFLKAFASSPRPRPSLLDGKTIKFESRSGTGYLTLNFDQQNQPFEVFVNLGKAGSDATAMSEALGRLISLALRENASVEDVVKQLDGVGGSAPFNRSVPDAVAGAILEAVGELPSGDDISGPIDDGDDWSDDWPDRIFNAASSTLEDMDFSVPATDPCPACFEQLVRQEGCRKCPSCDWSAC